MSVSDLICVRRTFTPLPKIRLNNVELKKYQSSPRVNHEKRWLTIARQLIFIKQTNIFCALFLSIYQYFSTWTLFIYLLCFFLNKFITNNHFPHTRCFSQHVEVNIDIIIDQVWAGYSFFLTIVIHRCDPLSLCQALTIQHNDDKCGNDFFCFYYVFFFFFCIFGIKTRNVTFLYAWCIITTRIKCVFSSVYVFFVFEVIEISFSTHSQSLSYLLL